MSLYEKCTCGGEIYACNQKHEDCPHRIWDEALEAQSKAPKVSDLLLEMNKLKSRIAELEQAQSWISVEEADMSKERYVLIKYKTGFITTGKIWCGDFSKGTIVVPKSEIEKVFFIPED